MLRGSLLWLFGVACGIAFAFAVLVPEKTPAPGADANTTAPGSRPGVAETREVTAEPSKPAQKPAQEPATEAGVSRSQPSPGEGEMPFTVFVLTDERYLDPAPDAVSVSPGEGPPATLVCEYRSEIDGAVLSRSSQYDSLILPPPSCPYEIQVPAP